MAGCMKTNNEKVLMQTIPDEVMGELLMSVSPVMPEKIRADSLRKQVLSQINPADQAGLGLLTVRAEEGKWVNIGPKVDMKVLQDDGENRSLLFRLHPGARLPGHTHPADEVCIMLEGEGYIGGTFLRAGDYHFAPQGLPHRESYSETGAVLFIRTSISLDNYR